MGAPNAANQPRLIKAEPRRLRNSRSPGVVSILKIPTLGACGALIAQTVIMIKAVKIQMKNIAVPLVHAIQDKFMSTLLKLDRGIDPWQYDYEQNK